MVNKKMLLSILIIGCAATVAGAGTWAFFDDSLDVNNNTITSGNISLVPYQSTVDKFTVGPIAPGDSDPAAKTYALKNDGTVDGHLYAEINATGESNIPDLTTKLNGEEMTDGATIDLGSLDAGENITIAIGYDFEETGIDQNAQQDQTVEYDITYHLVQE